MMLMAEDRSSHIKGVIVGFVCTGAGTKAVIQRKDGRLIEVDLHFLTTEWVTEQEFIRYHAIKLAQTALNLPEVAS